MSPFFSFLHFFRLMFFASILQAEIGPGALNLTDTSVGASGSSSNSGSSGQTGDTGKTPSSSTAGAPSPAAGASSGGRRPASPFSPGSRPSSKGSHGRGKTTLVDLEGELDRKIKILEQERKAMWKETHGQHEKINKGIGSVNHRITELEHSESVGVN